MTGATPPPVADPDFPVRTEQQEGALSARGPRCSLPASLSLQQPGRLVDLGGVRVAPTPQVPGGLWGCSCLHPQPAENRPRGFLHGQRPRRCLVEPWGRSVQLWAAAHSLSRVAEGSRMGQLKALGAQPLGNVSSRGRQRVKASSLLKMRCGFSSGVAGYPGLPGLA